MEAHCKNVMRCVKDPTATECGADPCELVGMVTLADLTRDGLSVRLVSIDTERNLLVELIDTKLRYVAAAMEARESGMPASMRASLEHELDHVRKLVKEALS